MRKATVSALLLTTALLTACGAGPQDNGVASINGGGTPSSTRSDDPDVPSDPQQLALKFAQCMRSNGVDMPDPKPNTKGGGMMMPALPADGSGKAEKALQACNKYSPMKDYNPNDPKEKERQLAFAKCMREHGVDVGDPGSSSSITLNGEDGTTKKALEACGVSGTPDDAPKSEGK